MNNNVTETILVVAACVAIVVGGVYLFEHVNVGCVNLGFWKSCGAVVH